jgi:hypothetical protein
MRFYTTLIEIQNDNNRTPSLLINQSSKFVIYYKKCVESPATKELDIIIELQSKGYKTENHNNCLFNRQSRAQNVCILSKF